ncbi:uncharacterized protein FIBRA_00253 [Fibroporia radiculosa]|uniref:Cell division control protein 14 n=1 Tax=Fibroporia radiculosa TaxID=599839 RepID=J7S5W0_9APHY|nr:uncharacterized protein FIBRA_00253 [Fibroporia radiculosa]CCL98259.1 predicted protein [Fibroporia radiculosa]
MKDTLQDALDELVSARTSPTRTSEVLSAIERLLAETLARKDDDESAKKLQLFLKLQDAFECNVPSRVLSWMITTTSRLEQVTSASKASPDPQKMTEIYTLTSQLIQALFIIQGVTLVHKPSKQYLGRRYALDILLELLQTSRHIAAMSMITTATSSQTSPPTSPKAEKENAYITNPNAPSMPLVSTVLDTFLCILVDSSPALRVFEELNGVQLVAKFLKRYQAPREDKMKCLEFLYFYLLDETTTVAPSGDGPSTQPSSTNTSPANSPPTSPSDRFKPSHRSKLSTSTTGSRDSSSSSIFSLTSAASTSTSSIGSVQSVSKYSGDYSSLSSNTSRLPSGKTGIPPIPALAPSPRIVTPPTHRAQSRSLLMLRKEVDYVPLSPKKAQVSRLGVGGGRTSSSSRAKDKWRTTTDELSSEDITSEIGDAPQTPRPSGLSHTRGHSISSQGSSSSTLRATASESAGFKTPVAPHRDRHRRAQSSADVMKVLDPRGPSTRVGSDIGLKLVPSAETSKNGPRTTEEKKEILRSMLGNVDTLVEGMRSAGIWGLG